MQAFIYARFSTMEQAKGSSLARQLADCRAMCDRRGWKRSVERELIDQGRSAYDGSNRSEGSALAVFERQALAGNLPDDSVLVVERWDRLSRQSVMDVIDFVSRITRAGVSIATVESDRLYQGSIEFPILMELVVKAQLSHEESQKKSQRVSAAWARKRASAAAGDKRAFTRRCPAWIAFDEREQVYVLRAERADIIRRIFGLATSGFGKHLIARTLNEEDVPAWQGSNGWHASYVQKILTSRACLGEMQPHKKVGGKRIPEGEPIPNFYPPSIDEATFAQAQADRATRTGKAGRRGKRISNLFSGIAKCGSCGGPMAFQNKGRERERYLVCDAASRGRSCTYRLRFNYPALERMVIDQTLHLALSDRHFGGSEQVKDAETALARHHRELSELEGRQCRLVDALSRLDDNDEIVRQILELQVDVAETKSLVADAERKVVRARGVVTPRENIARIRGLLGALNSDDDAEGVMARGVVQQALRSLVSSMTCDPVAERVVVEIGDKHISLDRAGRLLTASELGLASILDLRERGWIISKYEAHPALGTGKDVQVAANESVPED